MIWYIIHKHKTYVRVAMNEDRNTHDIRCHILFLILAIDIAILHQTTRKTSNMGVGRGVKGYWLLVSSTSSAEAAGCKEVKPARPAELTKNPILKQSNCFCHTAVRSNKRESYLRQQYCGIIGLSYSN